jgi:hypothetical protein
MKQTAVEWYEKEINSLIEKYEEKEISQREFITMKHNLFYKAKEMEKQQIFDVYYEGDSNGAIRVYNRSMRDDKSAEDYYNETFKK